MTHLLNLVDALIYSIHHLNDTLTCFGTPSFTCHYQLQIGWHYDYVQELRCWFSVVWLSCAKYRIYCAMVKDYYCFGTSVRSYFIGFGFYRSMINDKLTSMSIWAARLIFTKWFPHLNNQIILHKIFQSTAKCISTHLFQLALKREL